MSTSFSGPTVRLIRALPKLRSSLLKDRLKAYEWWDERIALKYLVEVNVERQAYG